MDVAKILADWAAANPDNYFAPYIKVLAGIVEFILSL